MFHKAFITISSYLPKLSSFTASHPANAWTSLHGKDQIPKSLIKANTAKVGIVTVF